MKYAAWLILSLVLAVLCLGSWPDFSGDGPRAVGAPPPLPIEKYLHEKLPEAPKDKVKLKVDNFSCYVCHGNYDGEELVVQHGLDEIGCIDCHGKSFAHRDDEDNITPPDKMYVREAVDKMCADCHDDHDVPARKVIQRWRERCPGITDPEKIVCTDCHGQHRLELRTVRWDKETGKVLSRQKAPAGPPPKNPQSDQPAPSRFE